MESRDLTSEHIRAARALLRWEQKKLAEASGVSLPTSGRLEMQPGALSAYAETITAIRSALEAAGIEFLNGGTPGVRIKPRKKIKHSDGAMKGYTTDPDEADRID
jgi:transcriptional regulator with XRE-family HTH domain